ncbi:MAG: pyridoxal phosphate-dependent aminotransferase [Lachnospiraceae bacterium]|nr:pyridoxal phosphate-dependent aminotransferase [Lachnospiraceae bacterium]
MEKKELIYDFDKVVDRKNTYSTKWNVKEGELPMWVADMDFETAPEIVSALSERLSNKIFGYTDIPKEWYEAYISWWKKRHDIEIKREWLIYSTGVIPTLSSTVRKITSPAENVVILTPVYNMFYNSILNNGRNVLESRLIYEKGRYSIDYDDLENKLANPQSSLMIFCNPHNPIGRIWSKEELSRVGRLCLENDVWILVDEIHCDLTFPGKEYVPFLSLDDELINNAIIAISPTKTFNLAGLQTSAAVIPDKSIRHKVWRQINTDEVGEPNAFAIDAVTSAFGKGEKWLDELRAYIYNNKCIVEEYLNDNIEEVSLVYSEATYLLWLDCNKITDSSVKLAKHIRKKTGLFLLAGSHYGPGGECFLRLNIACPKELLYDGLKRLEEGIHSYEKTN